MHVSCIKAELIYGTICRAVQCANELLKHLFSLLFFICKLEYILCCAAACVDVEV